MAFKTYRLNPRDREQARLEKEIQERRRVEDDEFFPVARLLPEGEAVVDLKTRPLKAIKDDFSYARAIKPVVECDRCDAEVNLDRPDTYVRYNIWNVVIGMTDDPDYYIHFAHPKAAPREDVVERVWCRPCAGVILGRIKRTEV